MASPQAANDNCANAEIIGEGVHSGTLVGATNDGTASCGVSASSPDVWYSFTANCTGPLVVSTCGTHDGPGLDLGIDTVLSVFDGCNGNELDCNDDDYTPLACAGLDNGTLRDSAIILDVSIGETFLIRVANYSSGATGPFVLRVDCTGITNGAEYCAEALYPCPCFAFSNPGEGCPNTTGVGATLVAAGDPSVGASSFSLTAAQLPDTSGLFVQGTSAVGGVDGNPVGEGRLCLGPQKRYSPQSASNGTVTRSNFQNFALAGQSINYQYWYRDPGNVCNGGGFNFTPAWNCIWAP